MADDNDDSWLYGGPNDEGTRDGAEEPEENDETAAIKNGNAEISQKNFENTFDEHNFEVSWKSLIFAGCYLSSFTF